jgi:hypothetical protein
VTNGDGNRLYWGNQAAAPTAYFGFETNRCSYQVSGAYGRFEFALAATNVLEIAPQVTMMSAVPAGAFLTAADMPGLVAHPVIQVDNTVGSRYKFYVYFVDPASNSIMPKAFSVLVTGR